MQEEIRNICEVNFAESVRAKEIDVRLRFGYDASAARLSEVGDKLHIEFSDVGALDVFAVEVDHVAVGYPAFSRRNEHFEFASPFKGVRADKSVVFTVEISDDSVCQIKRKSSRGRFSLDRSDRVT